MAVSLTDAVEEALGELGRLIAVSLTDAVEEALEELGRVVVPLAWDELAWDELAWDELAWDELAWDELACDELDELACDELVPLAPAVEPTGDAARATAITPVDRAAAMLAARRARITSSSPP
ncbi:MAG: hypothetical protein M3140_00950 [Actinomycetota bacterium]|nr:hypothetical protein [Actinomycetota bacterium]